MTCATPNSNPQREIQNRLVITLAFFLEKIGALKIPNLTLKRGGGVEIKMQLKAKRGSRTAWSHGADGWVACTGNENVGM